MFIRYQQPQAPYFASSLAEQTMLGQQMMGQMAMGQQITEQMLLGQQKTSGYEIVTDQGTVMGHGTVITHEMTKRGPQGIIAIQHTMTDEQLRQLCNTLENSVTIGGDLGYGELEGGCECGDYENCPYCFEAMIDEDSGDQDGCNDPEDPDDLQSELMMDDDNVSDNLDDIRLVEIINGSDSPFSLCNLLVELETLFHNELEMYCSRLLHVVSDKEITVIALGTILHKYFFIRCLDELDSYYGISQSVTQDNYDPSGSQMPGNQTSRSTDPVPRPSTTNYDLNQILNYSFVDGFGDSGMDYLNISNYTQSYKNSVLCSMDDYFRDLSVYYNYNISGNMMSEITQFVYGRLIDVLISR
jgi:hypothetical protein